MPNEYYIHIYTYTYIHTTAGTQIILQKELDLILLQQTYTRMYVVPYLYSFLFFILLVVHQPFLSHIHMTTRRCPASLYIPSRRHRLCIELSPCVLLM